MWPIARRELILNAVSCDDIDSDHDGHAGGDDDIDVSSDKCNDNNRRRQDGGGGGTSRILVRIQSLDCEDNGEDGLEILPATKGVRIKVDGGFVFEKCPMDHPMANTSSSGGDTHDDGDDNNLILLTFTFSSRSQTLHLTPISAQLLFEDCHATNMGKVSSCGGGGGDGKRPAHSEAIERKREALYDWVEERTNAKLHRSLSK